MKWGVDLQSEHERYISEKHAGKPVILMNYPKEIKAFYMRLNDDGKTVAAMDVLAPGIGEIIGGSQREERLDVLDARMTEAGLDKEHYGWYRDLRRYGTVPHAGFGLGFGAHGRVVTATGLSNVRDVTLSADAPGALLKDRGTPLGTGPKRSSSPRSQGPRTATEAPQSDSRKVRSLAQDQPLLLREGESSMRPSTSDFNLVRYASYAARLSKRNQSPGHVVRSLVRQKVADESPPQRGMIRRQLLAYSRKASLLERDRFRNG